MSENLGETFARAVAKLPIKADLRRTVGKEAGESVTVVILERLDSSDTGAGEGNRTPTVSLGS